MMGYCAICGIPLDGNYEDGICWDCEIKQGDSQ